MPETIEQTLYLKYPDSSLGVITSTLLEGQSIDVPDGAQVLTEVEYATLKAEQDAASDEYERQLEEAQAAQQRSDYGVLLALGVPDDAARRMSGWQGVA